MERKRTKKIKCPGCPLKLAEDDVRGQMEHMDKMHPDIIAARRAGAERLMGWAND